MQQLISPCMSSSAIGRKSNVSFLRCFFHKISGQYTIAANSFSYSMQEMNSAKDTIICSHTILKEYCLSSWPALCWCRSQVLSEIVAIGLGFYWNWVAIAFLFYETMWSPALRKNFPVFRVQQPMNSGCRHGFVKKGNSDPCNIYFLSHQQWETKLATLVEAGRQNYCKNRSSRTLFS